MTCRAWGREASVLFLVFLGACGGSDLPPSLPPIGITDLGALPGQTSSAAWNISQDGQVVVGDSPVSDQPASSFRWTAGKQPSMELLASNAEAGDVSADGAVVVGKDLQTGHAFRWTEQEGRVDLTTLGSPSSRSYAHGVSGDGNIVVGSAGSFTESACQHAFRWSKQSGMVDLGTLSASGCSTAWATSADGSVIVGSSSVESSGQHHAFRWTKEKGLVDLGTLGGDYSVARDVSGDGNVIVGNALDAQGETHAFRWTEKDGMSDLGSVVGSTPGTFASTSATGISANGLVITGVARTQLLESRGFRWTQATGVQLVEDWLRDSGIAVASDVVITSAYAANQDGSIVAGRLGTHAMVARAKTTN